ncbi:MAG: hypothetical protein GWO81_01150 [Verrucomicrobia bacterium]|nr:hypothetical protein [Verrucomicrobiota bacterium]
MPPSLHAWLNATLLIALCFGLPYGLHLERHMRENRAAQSSSPAVENAKETSALPEVASEPETPERPDSVALPPSLTETLLEEARRRATLDPAEAMAWLQEQDFGAPRLQAMLEVVALWAAEDAESTLLWLESNARGLARSETLKNGVALWSEQDPLAAATWIEGMASDGSKDIAAAALAKTWGAQDSPAAAQWIESIPIGPTRDAATQALLESWTVGDPYVAADWAAAQTLLGSSAPLEFCLAKLSETDPTSAETLVRSYLKTFPQAPLLEAYVESLARTDPNLAAEWYDNLPDDDPLKNSTASEVLLREWAHNDSVEASVWLSEQAPGPQRDAAINGFVQSIQAHAPEAATTWSNAINEPDVRIRNLAESLELWNASDPTAATAWLEEADLEPDLRRELSLLIQN